MSEHASTRARTHAQTDGQAKNICLQPRPLCGRTIGFRAAVSDTFGGKHPDTSLLKLLLSRAAR